MASVPSNGRPRPRHRVLTATVTASLCAGLLAGCGGSSGGSGPSAAATTVPAHAALPSLPAGSPERAACGLITRAEVEAALGGAKVGPGKEEAQASRSLCSFPLLSTPQESVALVSTTSAGVPEFFTSARDRAAAPQTVQAGDQAFVSGGQGLVRKGNTMVAILVLLRQGPAQLVAAATKLTQTVGTRL